jgi:hypothetical protein
MDMEPKTFLSVPLNEKGPNACSPPEPVDPRWLGILIRAPHKVRFKKNEVVGDYGAFAAIPVCGYYLAEIRRDLPAEPLRIVAVDVKTKKTYAGPITDLEKGIAAPPPSSPPRPSPARKGSGGGYFNPNLADFVELPKSSATYDVHVEFRDLKSNVVTIELILAED